jgi:prevent-host-death family protein
MALTKKETETRVVPALRARTQLGQFLKRIRETKKRFVIVKRGDPQAVIMSMEEYVGLFAPPLPIVEKMRRIAKRKGLDKISMRAIDQEIKRARRELHKRK